MKKSEFMKFVRESTNTHWEEIPQAEARIDYETMREVTGYRGFVPPRGERDLPGVVGYTGFYIDILFDADDNFVGFGVWE